MKNNRDFLTCVFAVCLTALVFTNRFDTKNNKEVNKNDIVYEDETFASIIEDNNVFSYERDAIAFGDDEIFNLLLKIFDSQWECAIRTNISNQHTLCLKGLARMMNFSGSSYTAVQYGEYVDLLWDWDHDGTVDNLLDARLTVDNLAHRLYADDVILNDTPAGVPKGLQCDTYFKNICIGNYFKSTRIDESGEYYHVTFVSLTSDRSAINFLKEEDCYVPSDLEVKVTEDGFIYGEGTVRKARCEELLAEYLRVWIIPFDPTKTNSKEQEEKELGLYL